MSQLRDGIDDVQRRAHEVLDDVRAGLPVPAGAVVWALRMLGEPVGSAA